MNMSVSPLNSHGKRANMLKILTVDFMESHTKQSIYIITK
jgi:hypothetical protein